MFALASTVFVAALLGSPHCAGMCGPLYVVLTPPSHLSRTKRPAAMPHHAVWSTNLGRLMAYVVVGLVAGTLGLAFEHGSHLLGMRRGAALVAGVFVMGSGLAMLFPKLVPKRWRVGGGLVRLLAQKLQRLPPSSRGLALGALMALMPCGWLYTFALTAAGTAHPLQGALVMAALWTGSLPIMLAVGYSLRRILAGRATRIVMGVLLMGVGLHTAVHRGQRHEGPTCCDQGAP